MFNAMHNYASHNYYMTQLDAQPMPSHWWPEIAHAQMYRKQSATEFKTKTMIKHGHNKNQSVTLSQQYKLRNWKRFKCFPSTLTTMTTITTTTTMTTTRTTTTTNYYYYYYYKVLDSVSQYYTMQYSMYTICILYVVYYVPQYILWC